MSYLVAAFFILILDVSNFRTPATLQIEGWDLLHENEKLILLHEKKRGRDIRFIQRIFLNQLDKKFKISKIFLVIYAITDYELRDSKVH